MEKKTLTTTPFMRRKTQNEDFLKLPIGTIQTQTKKMKSLTNTT
jgi:hypothetical protein